VNMAGIMHLPIAIVLRLFLTGESKREDRRAFFARRSE
jgi:hypothetical protein